jgi:hypothetical protein
MTQENKENKELKEIMMQKNRRRIRGDTIFTPAREFSQIRFEE